MRSIEGLIREKIIEKYPGGLITNFAADLKDILYTISYVTTTNLRMRTSKTTKLKHNVVLTNNQQNSFVDLQLLGEQEIQNINRLGNNRITAVGVFLKNRRTA